MPSERLMTKVAEIADKADQAYMEGRTVFAARTGLLWGEDLDVSLALLIEAIERQGWRMEQFAFDASGIPHVVFHRHDESRSLR